jgi:hypothetical protein
MSKNKKLETIDLLSGMLLENADHHSMHGRNLFQKTTLDLTEQALQVALTDLTVDLVLGN